MATTIKRVTGRFWMSLAILVALGAPTQAVAQSPNFLQSQASVQAGTWNDFALVMDTGFFAHTLDDPTPLNRQGSYDFTGQDRLGNPQTMRFTGSAWATSTYGKLGADAIGSIVNPYWSASNPPYIDFENETLNPDGSPDGVQVSAFANFQDVLTFEGPSGDFTTRFYYELTGETDPTNGLVWATMIFSINNQIVESYRASGAFSDDTPFKITSRDYTIPFNTPIPVWTVLSANFLQDLRFAVPDYTEGESIAGAALFRSTLTLAGIEVLAPDGRPLTGWALTSASGAQYPLRNDVAAVSEPRTLALLVIGVAALLLTLRRRRS